MNLETTLTTAEIRKLISIIKPCGGIASKAKAINKLATTLIDRLGQDAARDALVDLLTAPGIECAEGRLVALLEEAEDRAAEPEAPADPEPATKAAGPRPGTRAEGIFKMLTREGGATAKEMKEAGLGDVSVAIHAKPMAERYGYQIEVTPEGRLRRYALIPA